MAKKKSLPLIYLIGMALVIVGFVCPIFEISFFGLASASSNGFDFINFDNFGTTSIAALLIIVGAVLGLVSCFVKKGGLLKLLGLVISIAGGVLLIISYSDNMFAKGIGKFFVDIATYGFYMILGGWILGLVGYFTNK